MFAHFVLLLLGTVWVTATHAETEPAYAYYLERIDSGSVRFTDHPSAELRWVGAPLAYSLQDFEKTADDSMPRPFVTITSPVDEQAVRSNAGKLMVRAEFGSGESGAVSCELNLNGRWLAKSADCEFPLENLDRGRHRLQVRLKDVEDNVLAQSQEVDFHLLKYAIPPDQQQRTRTKASGE